MHDDHLDDEEDGPLEDNPIWQQDHVELSSVGIDVGSTTTQVVFSRIHLQRLGDELVSRYVVVDRHTVHESDGELTPYLDDDQIDAVALGEMLDASYRRAGVRPEEVDTGAVILTGEALRRRNSGRIAAVVADRAGDVVCAAAGHHMEAMLAALGSGAARAPTSGARVLNVDIGGGTTKLTLVEAGRIVSTAALQVGGRLRVVDDGYRSAAGPRRAAAAARAGLSPRRSVLDVVAPEDVADAMAEAVVEAVASAAGLKGEPVRRTWSVSWSPAPPATGEPSASLFSGGVGE